jgi:hypothetical protein
MRKIGITIAVILIWWLMLERSKEGKDKDELQGEIVENPQS